ncbi:hypothetical protein [Marinobacter halophilus]|uniref:Uncharacterized protein n=1 Tax=Marinobacter halophilus TaxID=1323740 RepID=A0A2T1KES1_9GAMM|nr:hypothetical protein [Marinobacter halophilus]PSF08617.1 hypothetical protein C7H08_08035 [Marinobacter halophilus]GGC62129.1 hypothetical protein GCM10011362_08320 [Marinobacter halophilus]
MTYDSTFDQARLDQLAKQHLTSESMTGRILFFGDPEENRLDLATWQLDNDEDYDAIKGSDFKLHMMELLDALLAYRAQHDQPNASQGVVHVDGRRLSIEWLPKADVEAMRNS